MKTYKVIVDEYQTIRWYNKNGKLHRENGPAIERANGEKIWYLNGKFHREDDPAVENIDGSKFWFLNGQRHRENGPAIEFADGSKFWFLQGKEVSEEQHKKLTSSKKPCNNKIVEIDGVKYKLTAI